MEIVQIYAPRKRLLLHLLGSIASVLASVWIVGAASGGLVMVVAVFAIAFFGLIAI